MPLGANRQRPRPRSSGKSASTARLIACVARSTGVERVDAIEIRIPIEGAAAAGEEIA